MISLERLHEIGIFFLRKRQCEIPCFKYLVRQEISKMNGMVAGSSGLLSEIVKSGGEAEYDMITDTVNELL